VIRLLIADDHPLVRAGFRQLATEDPSVQVIGEAVDGHDALRQLRRTRADVIVLDISMPGPRFLELIRQLREEFPSVRILVVSVHPEGHLAIEALQAGAAGYVTKTQTATELVSAVKKVYAGGRYVSAALGERLAVELQTGPEGARLLSDRERQVLGMLGAGRSNKEIAAQYDLSPKTVSTYRARILRKLALQNNADLVRYAMEHGIQP
jgi:DNA-binding NarL/FixJ family response regulator